MILHNRYEHVVIHAAIVALKYLEMKPMEQMVFRMNSNPALVFLAGVICLALWRL